MQGNVLNNPPPDIPEELIECLVEEGPVRIERIVSLGHASGDNFWYDQEENEFVLVVQGEAELEFENQAAIRLQAGSWRFIPAHQKHRVISTSSSRHTVWLAVFWKRQ